MSVIERVRTNVPHPLKPTPDGRRRWALMVLGSWKVYIEADLEPTSEVERKLELRGQWSPLRAHYPYGD